MERPCSRCSARSTTMSQTGSSIIPPPLTPQRYPTSAPSPKWGSRNLLPRTVFPTGAAPRKVRSVERMAGGPWDRAGVDRETWYAARMLAVAIRETARLPIDPTQNSEALPAHHERPAENAARLKAAGVHGGPQNL